MISLQDAELSVPGNSTNHVRFNKWSGEGVWKCPAANKPSDLPPDKGYLSYGYNSYGMRVKSDTNSLGLGGHYFWTESRVPAPPVSESEVVNPSEMIAIGDNFYGGNGVIQDGGFNMGRVNYLQNDPESTKRSYARHQSKVNVIFCDGHVESPALQFLFADTSDAALSRWNRDHQPHRERLAP